MKVVMSFVKQHARKAFGVGRVFDVRVEIGIRNLLGKRDATKNDDKSENPRDSRDFMNHRVCHEKVLSSIDPRIVVNFVPKKLRLICSSAMPRLRAVRLLPYRKEV